MIEQLLALACVGAAVQAKEAPAVTSIPAMVERVSPHGAMPERGVASPGQRVQEVEAAMLSGETSPSALARLWEGTTGWLMLMFVLYYHGLSLSVLGKLFGVPSSPCSRCWRYLLRWDEYNPSRRNRAPICPDWVQRSISWRMRRL